MSADDEARRHRLRATFEEVPELYDAARPLYPRRVFDDLVELANLEKGSRVLEIGPGTGLATVPQAKREALYTRIGERMGDRKVSKTLQAILNVARRL